MIETIFRDDRMPDIEIRWAGHATFNIWCQGSMPYHHNDNGWSNTDCFTNYGKNGGGNAPDPIEAKRIAEEYFDRIWEEFEEKVLEDTKDTEDIWHND